MEFNANGSSATVEKKQLHISMFGEFELRVGDVVINDSINRSRKMWNLLAYIIAHRDKAISQQEFIDALWGDDDGQNPINALKTLLYRIRILLEPLQNAYGAEFILSQRGSYSWNKDVDCVLDIDEFEAICKAAATEGVAPQEKIELYSKAVELYKGDFLPKLSMEFWAVPISVHYHSLYLTIVKRYAELLEQSGMYAKMSDTAAKALEIESLDEDLHCLQIRALIHQGKDAAALGHYDKATDLLYRNLGVRPSQALRELYTEMMKAQESIETDLGIIQQQLREVEALPGAFVCEFGFFKMAYRLEARRAIRAGQSVFIALFTVFTSLGEIPELNVLNTAMDQLLEALKGSLRKGDVVARYSGMQYVVMLPTLTYEDGEKVMTRIANNFNKYNRRQTVKLHYKLQQLELPEDINA
ncbi:MAG: winged helix-turn-helix domain-containing protein [Oscillospiraceae bacterium]|nr:winged helix-turn-helix domain-containing protein [Oscillospiraceae bacterium]MBP1557748.1 winged helix-turn-helix domain-containing protein [Oscillospiraceae bacterium]